MRRLHRSLVLAMLLPACGAASDPSGAATAAGAPPASLPGRQAGTPPPATGRILGMVEIPSYAAGPAFVGAGARLDDMAGGRPAALAQVGSDGAFVLEGLPSGTYFVGAFIDANVDGIPDRFGEPYVLWPEPVQVTAPQPVTGIVLRNFLNLGDPAVRTPERVARVEALTAAAESALREVLAAELPPGTRPERLLPTMRVNLHEATERWAHAADEQAWAFVEETLQAIPAWAAEAKQGRDPLAGRRGWQLFGYVRAVDRAVQPYLLYVPPQHDSGEPLPLVVALHTGGGTHWSGARMVLGLSSLADSGPAREPGVWPPAPPAPMLVAIPRGDSTIVPMPWRALGEANALHVLDAVVEAYPVDPDRVYLTGEGDGGRGVWDLAVRYPDRFAALLIGSGGTDMARHYCMNVSHLPVRVIHGRSDAIIPISHAREIVGVAARYAANVEYLEVDRGHDINDLCYGEGAAFSWFAGRRRPRQSPVVRYRSDRLAYNEGAGVTLTKGGGARMFMDVVVEWPAPDQVRIETRNVAGFIVNVPPGTSGPLTITCDGETLHLDARPAAIALDATPGTDGTLVWRAAAATPVPRSPLGPWTAAPAERTARPS